MKGKKISKHLAHLEAYVNISKKKDAIFWLMDEIKKGRSGKKLLEALRDDEKRTLERLLKEGKRVEAIKFLKKKFKELDAISQRLADALKKGLT